MFSARSYKVFSPLAGHYGRSPGSITLTGRNGTVDLLKNGYFTAIQVKYVELMGFFVLWRRLRYDPSRT